MQNNYTDPEISVSWCNTLPRHARVEWSGSCVVIAPHLPTGGYAIKQDTVTGQIIGTTAGEDAPRKAIEVAVNHLKQYAQNCYKNHLANQLENAVYYYNHPTKESNCA